MHLVSTNAMRRIGLRRFLPTVFTLAQVVLVCFTLAHHPHRVSVFHDSGYHRVLYQEGTDVLELPPETPPLNTFKKVSLILNLPAMFLAIVIESIFSPQNDSVGMYVSIVFVPFIWYAVGRWLDGLLGYIDRFRMSRILWWVLALPATFVLCVSLAGLTPLYRHRTPDSYWIFTGLAIWSGIGIAITFSSPAPPTLRRG